MKVILSKSLELDAGGKPVSTFPHPALEHVRRKVNRSSSNARSGAVF
jgi:hypothetical protein